VVVLGEWVLNSFFKELEKMPRGMIKDQSKTKVEELKEFAKELDITIVSPIVIVKKDKIYKSNVKVSPKGVSYFEQHFLINYAHWNEEKFFDNEISNECKVNTFSVDGVKFGLINGFELNFDCIFCELNKKKVDCVLIPSVSTFNSQQRWAELCKTRAFTSNCYVLRINRVGDYQDKNNSWNFYGDTFLCDPYGDIIESLGNKEEVLIASIDKNEVKKARKEWGFREHLSKRNLLK
jgi:predicted amidohydrolase